ESANVLASLGIPEPDRPVGAGRGDRFSIGTESNGANLWLLLDINLSRLVAAIGEEFSSRLGVPDLDLCGNFGILSRPAHIGTDRSQPSPVRTSRHGEDAAAVAQFEAAEYPGHMF